MKPKKNQVQYNTVNTYSTLNELTDDTEYVWIVLHGIGYLSRYFLKYFDELPSDEHYVIAPQAPSKYYLDNTYRHVGASWLTKEETVLETGNLYAYLDAILEKENIPSTKKLIVFGYSQGVSIATRWVAHRKIKCDKLILYAGGIPKELQPSSFSFLMENKTEIITVVGNKDPYLTEERRTEATVQIERLFLGKAKALVFDGVHEVKKSVIRQLF